jgi:hypothetical protein
MVKKLDVMVLLGRLFVIVILAECSFSKVSQVKKLCSGTCLFLFSSGIQLVYKSLV